MQIQALGQPPYMQTQTIVSGGLVGIALIILGTVALKHLSWPRAVSATVLGGGCALALAALGLCSYQAKASAGTRRLLWQRLMQAGLATEEGTEAMAQELLGRLEQKDEDGWTRLHRAANRNQLDQLDALI